MLCAVKHAPESCLCAPVYIFEKILTDIMRARWSAGFRERCCVADACKHDEGLSRRMVFLPWFLQVSLASSREELTYAVLEA